MRTQDFKCYSLIYTTIVIDIEMSVLKYFLYFANGNDMSNVCAVLVITCYNV